MLPCWNTRNQENSQAAESERRQHGLVEHRVRHIAVEFGLRRKQRQTRWRVDCGDAAPSANSRTSIWANEDEVYCIRGVGAT